MVDKTTKRVGLIYDVIYSKLGKDNIDDYLPVVTEYADDISQNIKLWKLYDRDFYSYLSKELSTYPDLSAQLSLLMVNDPENDYHNAVDMITKEEQDLLCEESARVKMETGEYPSREMLIKKLFEIAYKDEFDNHKWEMNLFINGEDINKEKIFDNILDNIGLDTYKNLVNNYNTVLIDAINSGDYPTNDEILNGSLFGYNKFSNNSKSL